MLKKTITYTDYDGNQRTEDHYFHLNKAEIAGIELAHPGGLEVYVKRLTQEQAGAEIYRIFLDLIKLSYGKKSDDGRRFMKSPEITQSFTETEAFSQLIMELIGDSNAAVEFVRGIIPADVAKDVPANVIPMPQN